MKIPKSTARKRADWHDKEALTQVILASMLIKSIPMFQWEGLPKTIPAYELEKILQTRGAATIAKADDGEIYAFEAALGGQLDMYYRPTKAIVSNPYLNLYREYTIGEDCVVIKCDTYEQGILPIAERYASLQAETEISLALSVINTRAQMILSAGDDTTRQSATEFLRLLEAGKQGVIADNAFIESLHIESVNGRTNDCTENVIKAVQFVKAAYLNEIGLQANTTLKNERLITMEVQANAESLAIFPDNMLECRKEGIGEIAAIFGQEWGVSLASSWASVKQEILEGGIANDSEGKAGAATGNGSANGGDGDRPTDGDQAQDGDRPTDGDQAQDENALGDRQDALGGDETGSQGESTQDGENPDSGDARGQDGDSTTEGSGDQSATEGSGDQSATEDKREGKKE